MTLLVKALMPFLANDDSVNELIAPPYDIVNHAQVQTYLNEKPQSIISVTRPDGLFEKSIEPEIIKKGYQAALSALKEKQTSLYHKHDHACFLVYQIEGKDVLQTGVLCLADSQRLMKHELTRKAKVDDRIALSNTLNCQISPVMLCTNAEANLDAHLTSQIAGKSPLYDVTHQDYQHRLFLIDEPNKVTELQDFFSDDKTIYITDGHHRSQTHLTRHQQDPTSVSPHVLSVIFPGEALKILGYHRIVKMPSNADLTQFWAAVETHFDAKELEHGLLPNIDTEFGCCINAKWYQLTFRDTSSKNLAIDILHSNLIETFFNVTNPKEDPNIDFVGGIDAIEQMETLCQENPSWIGFTIAPTTVEEIIKTADAYGIMPPKSTYFEPKLLDGFALQEESNP